MTRDETREGGHVPGGDDSNLRRVRPPLVLVWWLSLFAVWLLLTSTFDPQELVVGVVCSAVGAGVAELVRIQDLQSFSPRLRWLRRGPRLVSFVIADAGVVFSALIRHLGGRGEINGQFRAIPIDPGGDDGTSAARRALITAAISVTPNTLVVGIDRHERLILVHELEPSPRDQTRSAVLGKL